MGKDNKLTIAIIIIVVLVLALSGFGAINFFVSSIFSWILNILLIVALILLIFWLVKKVK